MDQCVLPLLGGLDNGPLFAPLVKRRAPRYRPSGGKEVWSKYMRAMPSWADKTAIRNMWKLSQEATLESGIQHSVDHVVPLVHPLVCGLHVENNLVVRPLIDNLRKGNRWWPDMPEQQGEFEW